MSRIKELTERARREAGTWLATATGMFYFLTKMDPRDVFVTDIAVGLARKCRYSGAIKVEFDQYSVAEHSDLMVKYMMKNKKQFFGDEPVHLEDYLKVKFHDGLEYVFPDVPTPIKDMIPGYRKMEKYHDDVIDRAIIPNQDAVRITKAQIKEMDVRIRVDERNKLIKEPAFSAGNREDTAKPLGVEIRCLGWREALREFLTDYVWAVENLPARDPENLRAAQKQAVSVKVFLKQLPVVRTAADYEQEISELKAEINALQNDHVEANTYF